ncbi:MAG: hypothetical protein ACOC5T_00870 [Elusimicrobiota bacterium]
MPIYEYQHPETKEIFSELRTVSRRNEPFTAPDGTECERIHFSASKTPDGVRASRAGMKLESFQVDPLYTKKCNPKYVRFRDGHRERYDPTKHC